MPWEDASVDSVWSMCTVGTKKTDRRSTRISTAHLHKKTATQYRRQHLFVGDTAASSSDEHPPPQYFILFPPLFHSLIENLCSFTWFQQLFTLQVYSLPMSPQQLYFKVPQCLSINIFIAGLRTRLGSNSSSVLIRLKKGKLPNLVHQKIVLPHNAVGRN